MPKTFLKSFLNRREHRRNETKLDETRFGFGITHCVTPPSQGTPFTILGLGRVGREVRQHPDDHEFESN
jgi:hypothetical protein